MTTQTTIRPTKIYLVSNRPIIRDALHSLIKSWNDCMLVDEPPRSKNSSSEVDVVLVDVVGLVEPIVRLFTFADVSKILMLADNLSSPGVLNAIKLGVTAIVLTDQSIDDLHNAIRSIRSGRVNVDARIVRDVVSSYSTPKNQNAEEIDEKFYSLTKRERQVASLIASGVDAQDIAERLKLSVVTVRAHLTNIFRKLEVPDSLKLVIFLYQNDFVRRLPNPETVA